MTLVYVTGVSSSQESLRERVSQLEQELASSRLQLEAAQREGEAAQSRTSHQLQEVQRQADASAKMVQDLHKQVTALLLPNLLSLCVFMEL